MTPPLAGRSRSYTKRLLCLVLLGSLWSLSGGAAVQEARPSPLDLSGCVLTFEDDFRTLDISARGPGTRWIAHTPWHGDFGDAAFADPGADGPFTTGPDGLTITARRGADGKWQSGLIASMDRDGDGQKGFAQRFGYFEMRAKFPDGPGVWPAFWLIGVDKHSAASEIDVVEYFGAFPGYFHSWFHLFTDGKDVLQKEKLSKVEPGRLTKGFNTYGVWIAPKITRFYLNGNEIWNEETPSAFDQPMYILADLALGGGWPIDKTVSPAVMTIAYIRVYQDRRLL